MKKIELVITDNIVLQEEIDSLTKTPDGFSIDTFYVKDNLEIASFLQNHSKIDLVIIDNIVDISSLSNITKISKIIVNLEPSNSITHCINIAKPFRIKELIDIIEKSRNSEFIYEAILIPEINESEASLQETETEEAIKGGLTRFQRSLTLTRNNNFFAGSGIIFNEESSIILNISSAQNIILTEKENTLIAKLLLAKDHILSKEEILRDIWGYSNNSETSTLETHISRLKNKLPNNLIYSKDGNIGINRHC